MKKPYIICHMMISIDGRIDCAMTSKLPGVDDYYTTLDEINVPTTVSGRVRAELEMAESGEFHAKNTESYGKEGFSKKADATGYEVIIDTNGKLLWPDASGMAKPYLIVTSEKVSKEYLDYLDGQNISWIACGKEHVDRLVQWKFLQKNLVWSVWVLLVDRRSILHFWKQDCLMKSAC